VHEASTDELQKLKDKLEQEIKARKDLEKLSKQIEITITPEGLRIELLEGQDVTFYEIGSPKLSNSGQELLALLASELKTLPNSLLLEGHTDSTPYSNDGGYSNWDLSADRANSARRLLQQDGVRTDQVTQVRGYADQMLRVKSNPTDPSNRRVSILVKNDNETVPEVSAAKIVDGSIPLPGAAPKPGTTKGQAAQKGASADAEAGAKRDGKTQPKTSGQASGQATGGAKPSAATPAAKPGLLDRLRGMLPVGKK
jgi:chemotaxis protein MotB